MSFRDDALEALRVENAERAEMDVRQREREVESIQRDVLVKFGIKLDENAMVDGVQFGGGGYRELYISIECPKCHKLVRLNQTISRLCDVGKALTELNFALHSCIDAPAQPEMVAIDSPEYKLALAIRRFIEETHTDE